MFGHGAAGRAAFGWWGYLAEARLASIRLDTSVRVVALRTSLDRCEMRYAWAWQTVRSAFVSSGKILYMSAFEFLSVGLSFVLGLGVTTVLLSFVRLFRIRATVRWDWIPLAWAVMIFVAQIEYWWGIFGFAGRSAWAFGDFLLLMSAALALFVASSVILPEVDDVDEMDLTSYFNETGRWALVAFAGHACLLVVVDIVLIRLSPFDPLLLSQVLPIALMMTTFATGSRRVQAVLTGIFLASMLPILLSTVPSIE